MDSTVRLLMFKGVPSSATDVLRQNLGSSELLAVEGESGALLQMWEFGEACWRRE
jgi:hypothetical protein